MKWLVTYCQTAWYTASLAQTHLWTTIETEKSPMEVLAELQSVKYNQQFTYSITFAMKID